MNNVVRTVRLVLYIAAIYGRSQNFITESADESISSTGRIYWSLNSFGIRN
jgi:hypothetical protein